MMMIKVLLFSCSMAAHYDFSDLRDDVYESVSWWTERLHVAPSPSLPTPQCSPSARSPGPPSKPAGKSPPLTAPGSTCSPPSSSLRTPALDRTLPQTLAPCSRCLESEGSSRSSPAPAGVSPRRVRRVPQPLRVWWPPFSRLPTGTPGLARTTKSRTSGSTQTCLLGSPHPVPPPGEPLRRWWRAQRSDRAAAGSQRGCGGFRRRTARFCWRQRSASPTCRRWRRREREGHLVWRRCRSGGNAWGRGAPSHSLNNNNKS